MSKLKISELNKDDFKEIDKIFKEAKKTNLFGTSEDIICCVLAFCHWIDVSDFESVSFDMTWEISPDKKEMH